MRERLQGGAARTRALVLTGGPNPNSHYACGTVPSSRPEKAFPHKFLDPLPAIAQLRSQGSHGMLHVPPAIVTLTPTVCSRCCDEGLKRRPSIPPRNSK